MARTIRPLRGARSATVTAVLFLALFTESIAQAPPATPSARLQCILPPPPFALTEANRLKDPALSRRIGNKTIKFERRLTSPNFNGDVRYQFNLRSDRSLIMLCVRKSDKAHDWTPCRRFNEADPKAMGRDVGVWRVEGGDLVLQRTALDTQGREEGHIAVHEQGGVLAARHVSGPHYCMPGPIAVE